MDLEVGGHVVAFINVYAPAQPPDRPEFFSQTLRAAMPADRTALVVMGGDFNCTLDPTDRVRAQGQDSLSQHQRTERGAAELLAVLQDWNLHDAWRAGHPQVAAFTHWSRAAGSGARLDRFYVSAGIMGGWQPQCEIQDLGPRSDHLPVRLTLTPPGQLPQGPGWRPHFDLWVLDRDTFRARFTAQCRSIRAAPAAAEGGPGPAHGAVAAHQEGGSGSSGRGDEGGAPGSSPGAQTGDEAGYRGQAGLGTRPKQPSQAGRLRSGSSSRAAGHGPARGRPSSGSQGDP